MSVKIAFVSTLSMFLFNILDPEFVVQSGEVLFPCVSIVVDSEEEI